MKTSLQLHAFFADGIASKEGAPRCGLCGLPQTNRSHQLPEQDQAAAEVEARRLGEKLNGASE